MFEVNNITKKYGSFLAVDEVSFSGEKSQVIGLLGPNGAGKSTAMKIMTTFLSATEGDVVVQGYSVSKNPLQVRKSIGYLSENCPLYLEMRVSDFLVFCAKLRGLTSKETSQSLLKVMGRCGLEKVQNKLLGTLSKGYRQRVGIAQALLHNPSVIILDEPTSGLDPNQIKDILNLIEELGQEKTIIHSTHILSEVESTSDRFIIINEGKIVAQGKPQDLVTDFGEEKVFVTVNSDQAGQIFREAGLANVVERVTSDENASLIQYCLKDFIIENIEEKIFNCVVQNNWILTQLETKKTHLDDVFSRLTIGEKNV